MADDLSIPAEPIDVVVSFVSKRDFEMYSRYGHLIIPNETAFAFTVSPLSLA